MGQLATALAPAFAAGFAVQRVLELLDPLLGGIKSLAAYKKGLFSVLSMIIGLALAFGGGLRVVNSLQRPDSAAQTPANSPTDKHEQPMQSKVPDWADALITALIISGGTEGFNSIMKFLGYKKDEKKGEAAKSVEGSPLGKTPQGEATLKRLIN